jgi:hypothetical protein
MSYDSARGRVVLFGGGTNEYGYLGDTWEWDGINWTQIHPVKSPSTRGYTSMAYDAARGRTVLFGGYSGTGGAASSAKPGPPWGAQNAAPAVA